MPSIARPLFLLSLFTALAAQPETSVKAISGATYLLTAKGPVKNLKSGEKTLGLSYQVESLQDQARVDDEATDLMSLLLPELELGHYQAAVIMADTKPEGFLFKTSHSFHSVFTRSASGEWLHSKEGLADPALAARLAEAYAKADAAFKAGDDQAIRGFTTPDYLHRLANGAVRTLNQDLDSSKAMIKSVSSWTTVPGAFFQRKDRAFVMTTQTWTGEAQDAAGKVARVARTTTCFDTWLLSGAAPKLSRSVDLEEKDAPAQ